MARINITHLQKAANLTASMYFHGVQRLSTPQSFCGTFRHYGAIGNFIHRKMELRKHGRIPRRCALSGVIVRSIDKKRMKETMNPANKFVEMHARLYRFRRHIRGRNGTSNTQNNTFIQRAHHHCYSHRRGVSLELFQEVLGVTEWARICDPWFIRLINLQKRLSLLKLISAHSAFERLTPQKRRA